MKPYITFGLASILAAMLSDGYPGGDENAVYAFVRGYLEENSPSLYAFLTTAREGGAYLRHHFFGDNPGGMMGIFESLVAATPIVPLIGSGRQGLYLIHVADLAQLLIRISSVRLTRVVMFVSY